MKAHVLRGSKQEIAETVARISGEVREAIVFIDEPAQSKPESPAEDIFLEMGPFTVNTGGADYSRDAVYGRIDGE